MKLKPYPKYKPSGVRWLGDIPEHWEAKRLKYTSSINDEILTEATDPEFLLEYVDIGSVSAIWGITSTERLFFENAPSRARRIVRDGDTIVSTVRTYLRAIAPIKCPPQNMIVSTGFAVVRPRKITGAFLAYALREPSFIESVVARSVGVSYPAVNASDIGDISIPLPLPSEQQAIVEFLDRKTEKIDCLIEKKKALLERLKEKRIALISHVVTKGLDPNVKMKPSGIPWLGDIPKHWEVNAISRISKSIQTGPFGSQLHASDYTEGGIPLINPAHIVAGKLIPDERSCVDEPTALRLNRHRLQEGDIVMARRGEIGRCGVVQKSESGWLCGTGSLIIRLTRCNPTYFATIISGAGFSSLLELSAVGTTMLNLNPTIIGRMLVPVPTFREQHAIVTYLDKETGRIDALVAKVEEAIERLQEYRTALISEAVTGKVDLRGE